MRLALIYRGRSLPIHLYSRDFVLIWHTGTSTLFCAVGVMGMLHEPSWDLFASAAFFGLCMVAFIREHLQPPFLRLDYGSFTWGVGNNQRKIPWAVVESFFVADHDGRKVVGWRYLPNTREDNQFFDFRGSVRGVHGRFYCTYGKKPEHLAALMNELCRSHHMTVAYLTSSHGA
ncbi:MAG: hypothetical protein AAFP03_15020 [Cyanobacteria bacterium J06598_3]